MLAMPLVFDPPEIDFGAIHLNEVSHNPSYYQ